MSFYVPLFTPANLSFQGGGEFHTHYQAYQTYTVSTSAYLCKQLRKIYARIIAVFKVLSARAHLRYTNLSYKYLSINNYFLP